MGRIYVIDPSMVSIGEHTILNEGVILNTRDTITIGSHVHISARVIINTGGLDYEKFGAERNHTQKPVVIGDGVWIGAGAIINPGVVIGSNSVIGAGAVVVSDIPSYTVAVGVPAQVIKQIAHGTS